MKSLQLLIKFKIKFSSEFFISIKIFNFILVLNIIVNKIFHKFLKN